MSFTLFSWLVDAHVSHLLSAVIGWMVLNAQQSEYSGSTFVLPAAETKK